MLAHHVGPRGTRAPLAHQRALRLPERAPRPRAQRAAAAWPLSNHTVAAWPAPAERASRGVCAVPRSRRRVAVRRQRGRPVLATASPSQQGAPLGPSAEPKKENFATRLLKPLRDFGFGRVSFWEGGVGLFVFAGIGAPWQPLPARAVPCWAGTAVMKREPLLASWHCAKLCSLGAALCLRVPSLCLLRLAAYWLGALTRAAGFALVLVSWARGGQLGGRGKGYQVRARAPKGMPSKRGSSRRDTQHACPFISSPYAASPGACMVRVTRAPCLVHKGRGVLLACPRSRLTATPHASSPPLQSTPARARGSACWSSRWRAGSRWARPFASAACPSAACSPCTPAWSAWRCWLRRAPPARRA
jgi:hypothetical protein